MKTKDFVFELPKSLIARYPNIKRSTCKLLLLNRITGKVAHRIFLDLSKELVPGDLLIFNDTRVIPARLYGRIVNGGAIEILVIRIINDYTALAYVRASKLLKLNDDVILEENENIQVNIVSIHDNGLVNINFDKSGQSVLKVLNTVGHIPIPPYFKRIDENIDYELYQTVYSTCLGSIAAPTAGLHFDNFLLKVLCTMGVKFAFITLHIGLATFKPVRTDMIKNHIMHAEYVEVSKETVEAILTCKKNKCRVIAVGTTVVKSLETASIYSKRHDIIIEPFFGYTRVFIFPGYNFRIVDAIITNFHLPRSTLIMLVSAFTNLSYILNAYHIAIANRYKFFSYGDAMFITDHFYDM